MEGPPPASPCVLFASHRAALRRLKQSPPPCDSRVMKQILLSITAVRPEIVCRELRHYSARHFSVHGIVFFAQDSVNPDIDWKRFDSFVGKEHDAIRDLGSHSRKLTQPCLQAFVR